MTNLSVRLNPVKFNVDLSMKKEEIGTVKDACAIKSEMWIKKVTVPKNTLLKKKKKHNLFHLGEWGLPQLLLFSHCAGYM